MQFDTSSVEVSAKLQPLLQLLTQLPVPHGVLLVQWVLRLLSHTMPPQSVSVVQNCPLLVPPSQVFTVLSLLFSKFGHRSTAVQKPGLRRPCAPLPAVQNPLEQVPVLQTPA